MAEFLPPPIPAEQLRELQRAIARAAVDRLLAREFDEAHETGVEVSK